MNTIAIVGRVTRKPDLRYTRSNLPYASFSVVSYDELGKTYFDVTMFGEDAEKLISLEEGNMVLVIGSVSVYIPKNSQKRFWRVKADKVKDLTAYLANKLEGEADEEKKHGLAEEGDFGAMEDEPIVGDLEEISEDISPF